MEAENNQPQPQPQEIPNEKPEKKQEKREQKKKGKKGLIVLLVVISLIVGGLIAYQSWTYLSKIRTQQEDTENLSDKPEKKQEAKIATSSKFADYEEMSVDITPRVAEYNIEQDLSNITNKDDFTFSEDAKDLLIKNSFVVIPADHKEFYSLYERNRYNEIPNFITTDSILHNYHMMFDHLLKKLEEDKLIPELKALNTAMLEASLEQYEEFKGTEWENAVKRNIGFFTVGSKLLDPTTEIPEIVKEEVEQELALIENRQGIKASPVMNIGIGPDTVVMTPQGLQRLEASKEDYTQYIPRGHYDKSEDLKAYFKAMMWYGRLTFRFKNEDEIKSALLVTQALNKENNGVLWNNIYEPVNFFVGKSDDISYYDLKDLATSIYGESPNTQDIKNEDKFSAFVEATKKLEPPQINSIPIMESSIQPDRENEIKGFRFMGQRFTIDAAIFQRLLYREVGDKNTTCAEFDPAETGCQGGARCLPTGLDIPAAMGSNEALKILEEKEETKYACYLENINNLKEYTAGLGTETWTQNLYWGWLYSLNPLTIEKGEGYPSFMRNQAWYRKDVNTYLGSWAELKHDTILYAKQSYAEMGGGPGQEKDFRGYVEPNVQVYARLASLLRMTKEGLESRNLLTEKNKGNLEKMETLATSLKTIAEKELNEESLSEEEHSLIKSYGGQLEHFWYELFSEDHGRPILNGDTDAPLVADVATDPNGLVLEEATGYISEIFAVVPFEGELRIAKGGVYSYYEFSWPMDDRLTDTKWKELLKSDNAPKLPDWTSEFTAK